MRAPAPAFDPPEVTQSYTPLGGVLILAPLALTAWHWPENAAQWALLASLGFWGGLGHWLLILAHRSAPAPVLARLHGSILKALADPDVKKKLLEQGAEPHGEKPEQFAEFIATLNDPGSTYTVCKEKCASVGNTNRTIVLDP